VTSKLWRFARPVLWVRGAAGKSLRAVYAVRQAVAYYGSLNLVLKKSLRILRHEGWSGLRRRATVLSEVAQATRWHGGGARSGPGLYGPLPSIDAAFAPKVSVIVPNFNHASYLRERLESIYSQTYTNFDVILLDDCSEDESREILAEYAERHKEITTVIFNETNSGGVFNQWRKGLSLAKGDLIWIAESDDHCDPTHLAELVRFFQNDAVMLAFCRTDFVSGDKNTRTWTSEECLSDTRADIWGQPFITSAHWLVNHAWGMKNVVINVSSAVFRHPGAMALMEDDSWKNSRLCGDWVFYLHLVRGGLVAYSPHTTNYYRQHKQGTSANTQKQKIYYREHEMVAKALLELYRLDFPILERQREALYMHWCMSQGFEAEQEFEELYSLARAHTSARSRKPNVLMVGFALVAGGGETFPITLANQLKGRGTSVSFLNCRHATTQPGVRRMLNPNVPLFELDGMHKIGALCDNLGVEIVHSHHAWADMTLAQCLLRQPEIKQVVTLHGMYEMMAADALANIMSLMERRVDRVVYTAEKNLAPFSDEFRARKGFVRIDNALEIKEIRPIDRQTLGIAADDFVLCLVSRAIREKGWEEAILAVTAAQSNCSRKIHLLLVGEGEEFDRLKHSHESKSIHFLGFKSNVRDYFAMADMGFLPSRFKGESSPLVLIDCLFSGRPVLASRIGEIPAMLQGRDGVAGELFDLQEFSIPVRQVTDLVIRVAKDTSHYQRLKSQVAHAVRKFDPSAMMEKYEDVYRSVFTE
jgi:glycosyltransferase involved in cell wall biosynthesis